ncbi:MAG: DNA polymerase III subunit alpha [Planctomyces sp.]|nr:DNA polymerase III subunit alpha [Planctomyces sp.]
MPDSRPFVHLHCHTHYSLLDGATKIPDLVRQVKSLGMNACAITDHGNLYGALEFYQKCRDAGLNPIVGYEAYIAPGSRRDRSATRMKDASFHLTLLAQNVTGFKNLMKMASSAYLEGYHYRPRIDKELLAAHHEGVICLSGCASSELSRSLLAEDRDKAEKLVQWYVELFGDRFYMEIQDAGVEIQQSCAEATIDLANRMGLPLVATNDAHYLCQTDSSMHDVLLCVNTKSLVTDTNRMKMTTDQLFVRSPEQMYDAFPRNAEAVARSQEIADRCDLQLDLKTRHFPVFAPPPGKTDVEYLREVAMEGLAWRYGDAPESKFVDRLNFELGVIERMGFASYFLIVWDFARFARDKGIPCSARGSACGAIVAYVLGLSDVCPIEYDLLFERFLDPNRSEAPDIDIDFCQDRRELVIQYVKEKYGYENVAQIGTFGTLKAKAAVRDVCRALGVDLKRADAIAKMVPDELNIKLKDALEKSPDLKGEYQRDSQIKDVIDFAMAIEGLAKSAGTHAAGVVIADQPLDEYVPLQKLPGKEDVLTQWTDVEKAGLLKMDFLGLRNLTILDKAVQNVKKHRGIDIVPKDLPLDDAETFALLQRGETKGIFQLESGGMRDLLTKMKPDKFADIIATSALYRPGPLEGGMVMTYVNCKHGREPIPTVHPIVDAVLAETYGVMVYQEQVMRILNRLGGIELASAYKCIKAISKKKLAEIAKYREDFLTGAGANGMPRAQAEELFGLIEKFAGYGFNKCLAGDAVIADAVSGERTTIEDLYRRRRPFIVESLGDDGRLQPRRVEDIVYNGDRPTFTLRTRLGRRITATDNHPFRTFDGWTNLGDLQPGDRIAAPRRVRTASPAAWNEHEVIVLAGLLSEGNTCHPTCLYFTNNSRALVDDFVRAASKFPATVARIDRRTDGRRMEVCLSTRVDRRFRPGQKPWNAATGALKTAAPPRSGAFLWAQKLNLLGLRATEKRVPAGVFQLPDDQVALFLGRLWSGDGFLGAAGQTPFYATSSECLAADVQDLLLRLGIVSRVHAKQFRYRHRGHEQFRQGYTVHLLGDESLASFVSRVLPHVVGRDPQVRGLLAARAALQGVARASSDTIPAGVRAIVDAERRAAGLGWRELQAESGVCVKELAGRGSPGKRGFRRSTILKLAAYFESRPLREIAESDVYWDTVVAIEPAGEQATYDLTVETDHNFIASGLIVHNSHSTAYGAIAYQTAYLKAHYPTEFMAALLSCGMESSERIAEHTDDARRMAIEVLPPDVNRSDVEFTVFEGPVEPPATTAGKPAKKSKAARAAEESGPVNTPEAPQVRGRIAFGLSAIRGGSAVCMRALVDERIANGPFQNVFDLAERIDPKILSKGNLEILIKAGALDCFAAHGSRAQHLAAVDRAIQSATSKQRDKARGQKSLFGGDDSPAAGSDAPLDVSLPPADEWTHGQKLAFEKEVLGFYMTSHPLTEFAEQLRQFTSQKVNQLRDLGDGKEVLVGGMISSVKLATTKQPSRNGNSRYANFDLEDPTGIVRCIAWPDDYSRQGELIRPESVVLVKGRIDARGREPNLIANKIFTMAEAEKEFTKQLIVKFRRGYHTELDLRRTRDVLARHPGKTPVVLFVDTWDESKSQGNGNGNGNGASHSDGNGNGAHANTPANGRADSSARIPLRAILSVPLTVTCSPELRQELTDSLGAQGFRFLASGDA